MSIAVTDWVAHHAYAKPDHLALLDQASGRNFTYADMHERVARTAGMLKAKGIKPGDRVAFLMLNSSDLMEVVFGCWRIGAVCLALNFRLTAPELTFILNDAEASMVVVDDAFADMAEALKGTTSVSHFVRTDCMGGDSDYEKGLATAEPVYDFHPQVMEDQCMLMYSSGTTGMPKGVIITHGMMYFAPASGGRAGGMQPDNVTLNNMPLFHIGAMNVTACPTIWIGATLVIQRMFDLEATLDTINDPDLGVTTLFMVPAAYNALRQHPKANSTDYSRIRNALTGGAAVPTELVNWWLEKGLVIQEGYGMTETAGAGTILFKEDIPQRVGSCGRYLMHSEIKIVGEDGETCPPDETGEIWFRGATVTPGYWRREDANAESFVDGWFKSGDIGRMDAQGYITIEDRIKDMYISGGENVYPAEVENLLYQMPQIVEVAVIGVPDSRWGETGCVVAVVKPDTDLSLKDILDHVGDSLGKFKWPNHLHILPILPRNASGKVLKFQLRDEVTPQLNLT